MLFNRKDKEGFEPTVFVNTIVFKTNALNHSTTYPVIKQKKGFEPSTLTLARLHSTKLSYFCVYFINLKETIKNKNSSNVHFVVFILILKSDKFLKYW